MVIALVGLVVIIVFLSSCCCWWVVHAVYWDVKFRWRLPPGSMGLPLLGESLHLVWRPSTSSLKPAFYFETRQARYGNLFKSHLFGEPVVVSTSASINAFVLEKEGVLFKSSYPASFVGMMGKFSLMATHDQVHAQLRRQIMRIVGSTSLPNYLSEIEDNLLKRLSSWENAPIIYLQKEACMMSFDLMVKRLIGLGTEDKEVKIMMENFSNFIVALISLPINIPGTSYNIGLKGRAKVVELLESIILKRTSANANLQFAQSPSDLLDALLQEEKKDSKIFTRNLTLDVMVGVIYAAYETIATTLTFAVMLLTKHPDVLDKLMEEHMAIQKKEGPKSKGLTWEDYKSMSYTKYVIFETLRLANTAPFVYRQAMVDVEVEGYLIPKGWKVITSFSNVHIDSANFDDPLNFNPSRWKDGPSSSTMSFMPFGGGSRLCAGNDLAFLEISIFLHHFLTKYKWKEVGEEQITRCPGVKFKHSYPIIVAKKIHETDHSLA